MLWVIKQSSEAARPLSPHAAPYNRPEAIGNAVSSDSNTAQATAVLELSDASFPTDVLAAPGTVLVDVWAPWCGPCRMVGPIVEEISKEYDGKAVVGKLDVDNNPEVSIQFGIRNIPALLFFKNGVVVDKQVGAVPKSVLVNKLNAHL